jgi:hypothetical protein
MISPQVLAHYKRLGLKTGRLVNRRDQPVGGGCYVAFHAGGIVDADRFPSLPIVGMTMERVGAGESGWVQLFTMSRRPGQLLNASHPEAPAPGPRQVTEFA